MSHQRTTTTVEEQYEEYVMPISKGYDPFAIEEATGTTMVTTEGDEYLDLFSGIAVTNVGHGNPDVIAAAQDQLEELVHTCSYMYQNPPVGELAERIAEITPGDLKKSFFANSGTEAVEGAMKLARKHTGSKEFVALEMSFHGRTMGSLALTGNSGYKKGMGPTINDVAHAPAPYRYRSPHRDLSDEAFAERSVAEIDDTIRTATSGDIAAIVVEPIMGEGGIIVPPTGWLSRVKEIAHEHDALLIADEVQTGYGRTGAMFASEHDDVVPDILTQAKGIADGLPLSAFTATDTVANSFDGGDHLSTFGGNPVACAGALASIDALQNGIVDNAARQGSFLDDEFTVLEEEFDCIGETRGRGLMWGIEIVDTDDETPDPDTTKAVQERLRDTHSVLVGVGGFHKNVLRIQPPLTISRDTLSDAVDRLQTTLTTITSN